MSDMFSTADDVMEHMRGIIAEIANLQAGIQRIGLMPSGVTRDEKLGQEIKCRLGRIDAELYAAQRHLSALAKEKLKEEQG